MRRSTTLTISVSALGVMILLIPAALAQGEPEGAATDRATTLDLYMAGTHQSIDVSQPPEPGQRNIIGSDLYLLTGDDAPAPAGEAIGRRVAVCTVVTPDEAICSGMLHLDDRGTLAVQLEVLLPGGNQGIAVIGGTGEFAGVSGVVIETMVPGRSRDRVLHVELLGSGGA